MSKLPYGVGTCFAVPLRSGGYAVGLVSRMAAEGKIILAYFFGPKFESVPIMGDVLSLKASDAIKILRVGDLGLVNGEWGVIGELPKWDPREWPVPSFVRRDDLSKRAWKVAYCDTDPSKVEQEDLAPFDLSGLERDALHGAGAVELLLTKALS